MKKIALSLFAALLLCSCNQSSGSKSNEAENDSLAQNAETDVESDDNFNFAHSDAKLFELFGKVKSMTLKTYYDADEDGNVKDDDFGEPDRYYFKSDGELDMTKEIVWRLQDPKIKRNSDGQIVKVSWYISEFDSNISNVYEYDKFGMVKTLESEGIESTSTTGYTYDENKNLASAVEESAGEGSIFHTDILYTITETDSHNNWTRRLIRFHQKMGDDDGSNKFTEDYTFFQVQVREIEYYE